ncbi:MAG: hypothetical protein Udaeo2_09110 [Candidatus Udaeobacter sp.]|nr:MAG: hypothetical protein Udaeo2_09110 [Candidatus Udaeobacter sp.]
MFSKRPEPRSIASQLILLFTLAATLLLACGLGVFYWIVVRHAFAEDNAVLADKVDGLQTSFEQRGGFAAIAAEINAAGSRQRAPFMVRVLDSAGATIGQTTGMETLLPPDVFPPVASRDTATPSEHRVAGKLFALTTRNALAGGRQFTIQVAQDRSSDEQVGEKIWYSSAGRSFRQHSRLYSDCDPSHQTRSASIGRNETFTGANWADAPERARRTRQLAARASAAGHRFR